MCSQRGLLSAATAACGERGTGEKWMRVASVERNATPREGGGLPAMADMPR